MLDWLFDKLKKILIYMLSLLWINMACMLGMIGSVENAPGIIEILLSILLLIVSIVILIKAEPAISVVFSTIAAIVMRIVFHGFDIEKIKSFFVGLEEPLMELVFAAVFGWLIFSAWSRHCEESDEREERKREAHRRGEACCPKCGSVSIQYYPLGIPYDDCGRVRYFSDKYHCNDCGYRL